MVFGWRKKKQEKETTPVNEISKDKEISLSDVPAIVNELYELRTSQTLSEIKHLRNNTEPLITDLIKIGNVLEKDNLKVDDIDKHLAIIVVRGKQQVIDVIKRGVSHLPEVQNIDDAQKLNSSLNSILKKVGDVLGRQTRVIHIFAKKYANQLKENLEVMNKNHSEINSILNNFKSMKLSATDISDILKQIKNLQTNKIEKTQKISDYANQLTELQEKITSVSDSIGEIKSSNDYKKYLDLDSKLASFDLQKSEIKNKITTQFTKISRPLGRYEYASSLDKDQKNILSKLVNDPFDVLVAENKESIIMILENVRKAVSSGSISVKDVDKTMSQITEIEEKLDELITYVSEYFEKIHTIQNEMNSIKPDQLDSLESELNKNNMFKKDSESKSESFKKEIIENDLKIPQLISKIEVKLRIFSNTKYTINPS